MCGAPVAIGIGWGLCGWGEKTKSLIYDLGEILAADESYAIQLNKRLFRRAS